MSPTSGDETGGAFADERQMEIARYIEEFGRARVTELADRFGVSMVTIRKDLDVLADRGRVMRTHGGAIAPRVRRQDLTYAVRTKRCTCHRAKNVPPLRWARIACRASTGLRPSGSRKSS